MEQANIQIDDIQVIGQLSWVAYIRLGIRFLIAAVIILLITAFIPVGDILKTIFSLGSLVGYLVYDIMYVRSMKLYTDEDGVWLFQGVFPWQKSVSGVLWRDLDSAVFFPNFFSWICRSYNIGLQHRHTKSTEVLLRDIHRGQQVVEFINAEHRGRFSGQA